MCHSILLKTEIIAECGFDENVRGETLSIAQFATLSNAIYRRKAK